MVLIYDIASGKRDGRFNCLNTADTISAIVFIFILFSLVLFLSFPMSMFSSAISFSVPHGTAFQARTCE